MQALAMAKNTCKLCSRRFANPRALAGHMRSHSVAAAKPQPQISSASSASTSFAAGDEEADPKKPLSGYVLRENPKRSIRLVEAAFSDRESENESFAAGANKRPHVGGEAETVSSVSDAATPEEDVALSLMMLSRDSWPAISYSYRGDAYSDDGNDGYALPAAEAEKRTRYQCTACKKVFRSYQALGGHRASHKRGGRGGCCAPPLTSPQPQTQPQTQLPLLECDGEKDMKPQPHQCPYCYRVFASGQALGGHKRSHICSSAAAPAPAAAPPLPFKSLGLIDLNLPAPVDDVEFSAVSDPFFSSKPAY